MFTQIRKVGMIESENYYIFLLLACGVLCVVKKLKNNMKVKK